MKKNQVKKASIALNLEKHIIGVKFIDFKVDYDALTMQVASKRGSICYHSREAMDGKLFKAIREDVACDYGSYALGLEMADPTILEGRSFDYCGLSETTSIGKDIASSMQYSDVKIYGFVMGPLEFMDEADVVIMVGDGETVMRIMQGYAYKYGSPKNLSFYGNQAVCSDLISKPYANNDINMSLMCRGARANGRFDKGEIGIAVPIGMFDNLVEGIVKTVNPVNNFKEKQRILNDLEEPGGLGIKIDLKYNYGIGLKEYDGRVKAIRESASKSTS